MAAFEPIGPDGQRQLFELTTDPYGEADVALDNPDVVQSLHRRLIDWLEQLDAPSEAIASLKGAYNKSAACRCGLCCMPELNGAEE